MQTTTASQPLLAAGSVRGVFFSLGTASSTDPQLNCAQAIIDLFNGAKKTAHVAIFTLTNSAIVDAMIAAWKRVVKIALVADAAQSTSTHNPFQGVLLKRLIDAGVDVRLASQQTALMHNKIGIFEGTTICTGSFNWTVQASEHNDENLVVLDSKQVAAAYEKYVFKRIWQHETTRAFLPLDAPHGKGDI